MNRWKVAFFVLLVLAVGSNLWWAYGALDTATILMYSKATEREHTYQACQATKMVEALGRDVHQDSLLVVIKAVAKDSGFIKEGGFHVRAMSFYFDESGRLDRVQSIRNPDPCATWQP